jgi:hypothetical protein
MMPNESRISASHLVSASAVQDAAESSESSEINQRALEDLIRSGPPKRLCYISLNRENSDNARDSWTEDSWGYYKNVHVGTMFFGESEKQKRTVLFGDTEDKNGNPEYWLTVLPDTGPIRDWTKEENVPLYKPTFIRSGDWFYGYRDSLPFLNEISFTPKGQRRPTHIVGARAESLEPNASRSPSEAIAQGSENQDFSQGDDGALNIHAPQRSTSLASAPGLTSFLPEADDLFSPGNNNDNVIDQFLCYYLVDSPRGAANTQSPGSVEAAQSPSEEGSQRSVIRNRSKTPMAFDAARAGALPGASSPRAAIRNQNEEHDASAELSAPQVAGDQTLGEPSMSQPAQRASQASAPRQRGPIGMALLLNDEGDSCRGGSQGGERGQRGGGAVVR